METPVLTKTLVRNVLIALAALVVAVFAVSRFTEEELPPLPEGTQTLTGTVLPTSLSLIRRGTHMFQVDGVDTYYLESKMINLRSFEEKEVMVKGKLERNTEPEDLPVLVVEEITEVEKKEGTAYRSESYKMDIMLPPTWFATEEGTAVVFRAHGSSLPAATLTRKAASQSFSDFLDARPESTPLVVGGRRAARVMTGSGGHSVFVDGITELFTFDFTPAHLEDQEAALREFNDLLRSISFGSSRSSEDASSAAPVVPSGTGGTATSSAPVERCGGAAGVLCPTGYYCAIDDPTTNTGVCRGVRR